MDFKEIVLPKKITPDPIVDSIVEIRFQSNIVKEKILPLLFNSVYSDFPFYRKNQTFEINDFTVDAILYNENYSIGIGPNVISFNCVNGYSGWSNFFPIVSKYLEVFYNLKIFASINRIGVRYINFFKGLSDLSSNTNVKLDIGYLRNYNVKQTVHRIELNKKEVHFTLNLADNVLLNNETGSLLDIDTSYTKLDNLSLDSILKRINQGHQEEKELFFSLLKEEFIKTLNPEY